MEGKSDEERKQDANGTEDETNSVVLNVVGQSAYVYPDVAMAHVEGGAGEEGNGEGESDGVILRDVNDRRS